MNILLLGKNGQVGWELQRTLAPLGAVTALGRAELDLTNEDAIRQTVGKLKPRLIVNAAAYTNVEKAEEEPEIAMAINATATGIIAEEAARCQSQLIHYSTDYVFDGTKKEPYLETDPPNPLNVYGRSKLAGEIAIQQSDAEYIILRTSWVYGMRGNNFLLTMLRLAGEKQTLKIIDDQIGAPTWCRHIAQATANICSLPYNPVNWKNIYHLTARGKTSWAGFATAIFSNAFNDKGNVSAIIPVSSEEFTSKAIRPLNSVMSNSKITERFQIIMQPWQDALKSALSDSAGYIAQQVNG